MPCLPGRCIRNLPEDAGVTILRAVAVAADHRRFVALAGHLIEECLVVGRTQAMTGLPGRRVLHLPPDCSVTNLRALQVTADPVERIALAGKVVECHLIIRCTQAVARDPGAGWALMEDAGEAGA